MIEIQWLRDDEVISVRPDGPVGDANFQRAAETVDPVIERRGRLEGLLIDARGFSGWDDARALLAHPHGPSDEVRLTADIVELVRNQGR